MKIVLLFAALLPILIGFVGLRMNTVTLPRSEFQNMRAVTEQSHLPATIAPVLQRACRDCHSNQTVWPWYSHVPPISSVIRRDVERGRAKFNFSQWASGSTTPTRHQLQEICAAVSDDSMPPRDYRRMHGEAKLAPADVEALCRWAEDASSAGVPQVSAR